MDLDTTTAALKPERVEGATKVYRVARDLVLDAGERAAIKFWAEQAGTVTRVVIRFRPVEQARNATANDMRGRRELKAGDVVELEAQNTMARPAVVNVWVYFDPST